MRAGIVLVAVTWLGAASVSAAPLRSLQTGTTTVPNGSATATATLPTAVDLTKAFLVFGLSESTNVPNDGQVTGQLTAATTVTFQRMGTTGDVTVKWYVAEFESGVRVQRGSVVIPSAPNPADQDVPIASVDLGKSFPIVTLRTDGGTYDSGDFMRAKITTATNLRIFAPDGGFFATVEWQVVEYTDASVQTGDVVFANTDTTRTALVAPAVNLAKSWLLYSYECAPAFCNGDATNIGSKLVRGVITNATTLTFDRAQTGIAGESINLTWYLVEFTDGTTVQSASEPFGAAETFRNVTVSAVSPRLALAAAGAYGWGGRSSYNLDDVSGVSWFTLDLTSATNLRITRGTTGSPPGPGPSAGADVGWFVVSFDGCCDITTTEAGALVTLDTVTTRLVWDAAKGAGLRQAFVKNEPNPATSRVGSDNLYNLQSTQINDGTWHFETDAGGRLSLLEATPVRVRLRQQYDYTSDIHLQRDWTITSAGLMRVASQETLTFDTALSVRGVNGINARAPAACPGTPFFCAGQSLAASRVWIASDDTTTYSDVLAFPYTNPFFGRPGTSFTWPVAFEDDDSNPATPNTFYARVHEPNPIATGPLTDTKSYLLYPKLAGLTSTGPASEWQAFVDDHRTPENLNAPTPPSPGSIWFDPAENTSSPSDTYNEAEAAYPLNIDPVNGVTFDVDGGTTARLHPFFKIRQWRSLAGPASITLEGAPLVRDVDYHSAVKPVARAHFAQDLLFHSTLQDAAALSSPDVGPAATLQGGAGFTAGRYGNGVRTLADGDSIAAPGVYDGTRGAFEFWFQPAWPSGDGAQHDIMGAFVDVNNESSLIKLAAGDLRFRMRQGGINGDLVVAAANYRWDAGEWVHLRVEYDLNAPLATQQRLFLNGVEPPHVDPVNNLAPGPGGGPPLLFGDINNGSAAFSAGIYDEVHIYGGSNSLPAPLAHGGLTSSTEEYFADPAKNFSLAFSAVNATRQGEYLYLGADSQFRGLNVGLATLGAGVAAGDLDWEYWNGTAWTNLESVGGFTDLTNSFTKSGNVFWTSDPAGWGLYSVNGGPDLYYVRAHLKPSTAYSTTPIEGLIKTDILLLQYCGDITLDAQTFSIPAPIPTAVMLSSFEATARDSAVDLSWTTATELQNLGFHLYRSLSEGGPWTRITASLIPGLGNSPTGASYAWRDSGLQNSTTYYYLLEDVETTGWTERHGPVSATPQAGLGGGGSGGDEGEGSGDGSGSGPGTGRITYGDPSATSLRILERGPSHVVLELLTPGFTALSDPDGTVRISIPGFEDIASPGALAVPVRHALVEALVGRKVLLSSITPKDIVSFDGFRLSAAGSREVVVTDEGVVKTGSSRRHLLQPYRRGGFAPRLWTRLLGSVFQGETKKARLELAPFRHDPATGRTVLARRLLVRLEFTGIESGERSLGGSRGRRPYNSPLVRAQGVVAQLVAHDSGLYRVRFEEIFGPTRRGVNAASMRLSRLGLPVAYHLEPDRSLFGPGSSLFFLSEGSSLNPRGDAVYELSLGQTASRMGVVSGSPTGPTTTEYLETLKLEENHYYQAALLQAKDLWLWDLLVSPVTKSYSFTVTALSPSSTSSHLKVVLQGASDFEELDHHVRVSLNGVPIGEATWDGKVEQVIEAEVNAGILVEGSNTLSLENVGDAGAAYSMVFLNRFEMSYPRLLTATSGKLEGRFDQSGRAEVRGLTANAFVVDTTSTPVWLKSTEATPSGHAFHAEAERSYLAVSDTTLLTPVVRLGIPSGLKTTAPRADWILIGPREFLPAVQALVDLRRSQGLLTKTVALEDVYAEFGFGESSPKAIHDFLAFAFHNWKTKPRYVVLLGDSTYDPKDYLQTHVKDRIPSPIVETSYLWTTSDPSLAAVNGEDLLPDLAIGRLSAGTLEEAQRLITKLVAFEQAGRTFDGKAVLVADNADLAGNFEADQDEIASSILTEREVEKVYLRDLGGATRATIKAAFDSGPGLVSYVGHGATAVWASENVWNNTDIPTLADQDQQPLLLTLNCLNGFFHFPPFDSLAEAFVKAEGKGAIAAFAPSGLSVNDAAHLYHKAFLTEIASARHTRLGDALLAAQKAYADQGAMPELLSIYHLFGDPGLRIR